LSSAGSFHLHGVDDNGALFVENGAKEASLQITSLDAALVSAGTTPARVCRAGSEL
jgi:hypothetical protein